MGHWFVGGNLIVASFFFVRGVDCFRLLASMTFCYVDIGET